MKFVLASNNPKKLEELRAILSGQGFDILSLREAGITAEPEETGTTFEENALIKARAAMEVSGLPAIADDSGLCADALGGAPGVYSARYGGGLKNDTERYELLLKNMEGQSDRAAKFVSAIACVFPNGNVLSARGECAGELLRAPRGEGGFGYDPVFLLPQYGLSMAEIGPELKNRISHRAAALNEFRTKLEKYIKEQKKEWI